VSQPANKTQFRYKLPFNSRHIKEMGGKIRLEQFMYKTDQVIDGNWKQEEW
jgi:hypothetical protein